MEQIFEVLKSYHTGQYLTDEMTVFLRDQMEPIVFNKGEEFENQAGNSDHIYFIEKGLIRETYSRNHRTLTRSFKKEGQFIVAANPFLPDEDGDYDLERIVTVDALENTVLWFVPNKTMHTLYDRFQNANMIHIDIIMKTSMIDKNHYRLMQIKTVQDRFDFAKTRIPELLQRVAPKYMAPYLDIPEGEYIRRLEEWKFRESN